MSDTKTTTKPAIFERKGDWPRQGGSFVKQGDGTLKNTREDEPVPPSLSEIDGIGKATVKALEAAGIADIASLAAVDPNDPPTLEGFNGALDWVGWVEAAKALLPETGTTNEDDGK